MLTGPAEDGGGKEEGGQKDRLNPLAHIGNQEGGTDEQGGKGGGLEGFEAQVLSMTLIAGR